MLEAIKEQRKKLDLENKKNILNLLKTNKFAVKPTKFLDDKQKAFAKVFFTYHDGLYYLDEKKLVEYIIEMDMLPEDKVIYAIKTIMDRCEFKYYKEHIDWLKKNIRRIYEKAKQEFERRNTITLKDTGEDIEIIIRRRLTTDEIRKLMDAFTTVYYTQDQMGNLTEHKLRVIKYDKLRKAYRIPYFATSQLFSVAKELGFRKILDRVEWVKREIPKPPKFDIRLYNFQKEALKAWMKAGCRGTIVVPTGGGKTYIGMAALYYMSVPTLICVTTIELARQWRQKLKEHLGIHAGLLGGGNHDIEDVTVAIYNSAVNYVDELKDRFDLIIFDECLTYDTLVLTDRGWIPIGEIVEKRLPVKVLTHKGRFMPVIEWHKIPLKKRLVRVVFEDGSEIKCTEDHKFLTSRGWIVSGKLNKVDFVVAYEDDEFYELGVAGIEKIEQKPDFVYDIAVAEDHSYVANGVIVHNCHHVPAETFRKVAFQLKARKRLGLSATPKRIDRNEALIFFSVGDVIYQAKYEEMVRLKLAAPLKYYRFYVNLTPEEEEKYAAEEGGSNNLSKVQKLMKIAFMAKEKYELLKKVIQKLPDDKILVFCQYIEQAKKAYKAVREVAKGQVVLLTGETNAKLRKKYFEEFKEGKKRIIVTTTVLDEGIDVPDAETAVILSGTGTERQMIQRIGRVIRYRPNKVAKVIEIVTKNTVEERIADKRGKVLRDYGIKRR